MPTPSCNSCGLPVDPHERDLPGVCHDPKHIRYRYLNACDSVITQAPDAATGILTIMGWDPACQEARDLVHFTLEYQEHYLARRAWVQGR